MKKLICILLSIFVLCSMLSACGTAAKDDGKIKVVATIFPLYDWTREVSNGADLDLSVLIDSTTDMHSYQPSAKDIINISDCDLFIYVGGESDEWVTEVLDKADNDSMVVLNLLEILDNVKKSLSEEHIEGMQEEAVRDEEDEDELDEHIWLSLKNAQFFTGEIAKALNAVDHANADLYDKNASNYKEELKALDTEYQTAINKAEQHTLLFADRFPFRYLTEDYDLSYYAAFSGCSAESEASFETIDFLVNKVDELNLSAIIKLESSDGALAETVKNSTKAKNQEILTLDSMQSTPSATDSTYLSIMQSNLSVIEKALG